MSSKTLSPAAYVDIHINFSLYIKQRIEAIMRGSSLYHKEEFVRNFAGIIAVRGLFGVCP